MQSQETVITNAPSPAAAPFEIGRGTAIAFFAAIGALMALAFWLRDDLREADPAFLMAGCLVLLGATAAFSRWHLRFPWVQTAQLTTIVLIVELAILSWLFAGVVERFEGPAVLAAFFVAMLGAATVILPAPTALTVVALGTSVGDPIGVGLAAAAGQTVGEGVGYFLGRSSASLLENTRWVIKLSAFMRRSKYLADAVVLIFAAFPNPFFDFIGIVAGTLRYPVWRYAVAAYLGNAFKYVVIWGGLGALLI